MLIESRPGSAVYNHTYDLVIDDQQPSPVDTQLSKRPSCLGLDEQYQIDHEADNATATQAVRAFLSEQVDNQEFQHEIRLLSPILSENAGILYVSTVVSRTQLGTKPRCVFCQNGRADSGSTCRA